MKRALIILAIISILNGCGGEEQSTNSKEGSSPSQSTHISSTKPVLKPSPSIKPDVKPKPTSDESKHCLNINNNKFCMPEVIQGYSGEKITSNLSNENFEALDWSFSAGNVETPFLNSKGGVVSFILPTTSQKTSQNLVVTNKVTQQSITSKIDISPNGLNYQEYQGIDNVFQSNNSFLFVNYKPLMDVNKQIIPATYHLIVNKIEQGVIVDSRQFDSTELSAQIDVEQNTSYELELFVVTNNGGTIYTSPMKYKTSEIEPKVKTAAIFNSKNDIKDLSRYKSGQIFNINKQLYVLNNNKLVKPSLLDLFEKDAPLNLTVNLQANLKEPNKKIKSFNPQQAVQFRSMTSNFIDLGSNISGSIHKGSPDAAHTYIDLHPSSNFLCSLKFSGKTSTASCNMAMRIDTEVQTGKKYKRKIPLYGKDIEIPLGKLLGFDTSSLGVFDVLSIDTTIQGSLGIFFAGNISSTLAPNISASTSFNGHFKLPVKHAREDLKFANLVIEPHVTKSHSTNQFIQIIGENIEEIGDVTGDLGVLVEANLTLGSAYFNAGVEVGAAQKFNLKVNPPILLSKGYPVSVIDGYLSVFTKGNLSAGLDFDTYSKFIEKQLKKQNELDAQRKKNMNKRHSEGLNNKELDTLKAKKHINETNKSMANLIGYAEAIHNGVSIGFSADKPITSLYSPTLTMAIDNTCEDFKKVKLGSFLNMDELESIDGFSPDLTYRHYYSIQDRVYKKCSDLNEKYPNLSSGIYNTSTFSHSFKLEHPIGYALQYSFDYMEKGVHKNITKTDCFDENLQDTGTFNGFHNCPMIANVGQGHSIASINASDEKLISADLIDLKKNKVINTDFIKIEKNSYGIVMDVIQNNETMPDNSGNSKLNELVIYIIFKRNGFMGEYFPFTVASDVTEATGFANFYQGGFSRRQGAGLCNFQEPRRVFNETRTLNELELELD